MLQRCDQRWNCTYCVKIYKRETDIVKNTRTYRGHLKFSLSYFPCVSMNATPHELYIQTTHTTENFAGIPAT